MNDKKIKEIDTNEFAFNSLNSVRKKLLDLSNKNALLNYKHPKVSCVRIIEASPSNIIDKLRNGKKLNFISVPKPTEQELIKAGYIEFDPKTNQIKKLREYPNAEKWANYLGFNSNYELQQSSTLNKKHYQGNDLQTLLYSKELETNLRNLHKKSITMLEENGTEILYLNIGFLEWDEKRIAPLLPLPVQLEKATYPNDEGVYHYTITLKEDTLLTNITLLEKLENDFNLALPVIDENFNFKDYFEKIQNTILKKQPNWSIRYQITLLLLNFTKQAMYQDLNPDNWPDNANIQKNPLISKFFTITYQNAISDSLESFDEYEIDQIEDIEHKYPIIFDADSSQHSALIDAIQGKNLVIEGPPGSGKSQTIANLIAAYIANGKRVLFVAEKMAALNVVKNRLDKAELGVFCLELHSHKTNKQKMLKDLNLSIHKRKEYCIPESIKSDIVRLEDFKNKLTEYVKLINKQWKKTGLTIHDILNKVTRYREQLNSIPDQLIIKNINGNNLTPVKQKELFDRVDMFRYIYEQTSAQAPGGKISNHYWYGLIIQIKTEENQAQFLIDKLANWNKVLNDFKAYWLTICTALDFELEEAIDFKTIRQTAEHIEILPNLINGELLSQLNYFIEQSELIEKTLNIYEEIHKNNAISAQVISPQALHEAKTIANLKETLVICEKLGISSDKNLQELNILYDKVTNLKNKFVIIEEKFNHFKPSLPLTLSNYFTVSLNGLHEFRLFMRFISILPFELWRYRNDVYDNVDVDSLIKKMQPQLEKLQALQKRLQCHFELSALPEINTLKKWQKLFNSNSIFNWFIADWRKSRKALLKLNINPRNQFYETKSLLPDLIEYAECIKELDKINQENNTLQKIYQGIETPLDRIIKLRDWYKAIRVEYGFGFGERVEIGNALLKLDKQLAISLSNYVEKAELIVETDTLEQEFFNYSKAFENFAPLKDKNIIITNLISQLSQQLYSALTTLNIYINSHSYDLQKVSDTLLLLQRQQEKITIWQSQPITVYLRNNGVPFSIVHNKFSQPLFDLVKNTLAIAQVVAKSPILLSSITAHPSAERYQAIKQCLPELQQHQECCFKAEQQFIQSGHVQIDDWTETTQDKLDALIARNEAALNNPKWLHTWLDYLHLRNKLLGEGLGNIISQLEANIISTQILNEVVQFAVHNELAKEILKKYTELAAFNGMEQMAIRAKFQEYDHKLMLLQREMVAYKASRAKLSTGINIGKVSEYTELGLINHNLGLKKPRITVRALIQRASQTIQALKPCFMMSPMSVAQYLAPGQFDFDVVIIDEASQVRPEDALGAIARAKSLVVVGDPKQLPPTTFFQKNISNEIDNDAVALEESESILGTVMSIFKTRRLRWHYRSRHESLIAFSNQFFYDTNLVLFPSPYKHNDEFGIYFNKVEKGCFVNRRNIEEAKYIIEAVVTHFSQNPHESIGIVAMNSEQSDEIDQQIEQLCKDEHLFQKNYEYNQSLDEPLFVKNLENVQGDERDVIIISMTYGPETTNATSMSQRFGPINSNMGWRRLNVLFTRAKKRMLIYSSMTSAHVRTSEKSSRGVVALKAFLEYCETGFLRENIRHTSNIDNDFHIAVKAALAEHGYECETQIGVSGYFIDLAVKDPNMSQHFLLGIECDGANYYAAKSTRDRDRLRQEILENLGWRIYRIWSPDWFKNPQAQLQPILNVLEELKTSVAPSIELLEKSTEPVQLNTEAENAIVSSTEAITKHIETFAAKEPKAKTENIAEEISSSEEVDNTLNPCPICAYELGEATRCRQCGWELKFYLDMTEESEAILRQQLEDARAAWTARRYCAEYPTQSALQQKEFKDSETMPLMVRIGAGQFEMGSNRYDDEKPVHTVKIGYDFALGKYPVTFEEYDAYCEAVGIKKPNDSGWGRGKRPVINVSWEDAVAYCDWLSEQTGQHYRLPSEAEWEYACRAGTTTAYWWGGSMEKSRCWYGDNSGGNTHPVDEAEAQHTNPWGLVDMHGNVWEWCQDRWHGSYQGTPSDGSAWESGDSESRLLRGGSWYNLIAYCRAAYRNNYNHRSYFIGFRVSCD